LMLCSVGHSIIRHISVLKVLFATQVSEWMYIMKIIMKSLECFKRFYRPKIVKDHLNFKCSVYTPECMVSREVCVDVVRMFVMEHVRPFITY
jgi:hypothetical protein